MRGRLISNLRWTLPKVLIFTFIIWTLTTLSKVLFNGLIFGFDYGLFHPDGAFYTFRTLLFAGHEKAEAGQMVSEWYAIHPAKPGLFDPTSLYYENASYVWSQYGTRILYPILSVPFVKLFGIWGMLFVPALTYLATLLIIAYIGFNIGRPGVGIFVVLLATCSVTISRWMYINSTDGLLMLFTAIFVLSIFRNTQLNLTKSQLIGTLTLIAFSSLTRFSALMWIFIGLIFLVHKKYRDATLIVSASIFGAIPIFMRPFGGHVLPALNEKSNFEKALNYPISFLRLSFYEIGQLFVLDRVFFWTLILTLGLAFFNVKRLESQFFLAALIGLWITGSLNAVLGVNFRYQIPLIPFLLWALVVLLPSLHWTHSRNLRGIFEATK